MWAILPLYPYAATGDIWGERDDVKYSFRWAQLSSVARPGQQGFLLLGDLLFMSLCKQKFPLTANSRICMILAQLKSEW